MRFSVYSKDHKESWDDYSERLAEIKAAGFSVMTEVSGDCIGIDGDFMVFTNQEESDEFLVMLVKIAFEELFWLEELDRTNTEEEIQSILKNIEYVKKSENYLEGELDIDKVTLNNGSVIEFVGVPTKKVGLKANEEIEPEVLLERIRKWQEEPVFHELTCGNDSRHELLKPVIEESKVVLICPTCDYKQVHIPKIFYNEDFDEMYQQQLEFMSRFKTKEDEL